LDLDEEVAFDGGGPGVVDLGLVFEDDGEFWRGLGVPGHDFDVLVRGWCGAADVAVAAQAEFRLALFSQPAGIGEGDVVPAVRVTGGVESAAVPRVMAFTVVAGLEWVVGVGGLSVLDGDGEVGGGVVRVFVEGEFSTADVRIQGEGSGVEEEHRAVVGIGRGDAAGFVLADGEVGLGAADGAGGGSPGGVISGTGVGEVAVV